MLTESPVFCQDSVRVLALKLARISGRSRYSKSAPAIKQPTTPPRNSPLKKLARSPNNCAANITTANFHAQRRRRNQPIPERVMIPLRKRNAIPAPLPIGANWIRARVFSNHIPSSMVPGQAKLVPARAAKAAPKSRKTPMAERPPRRSFEALLPKYQRCCTCGL
jgi:hypothetical protein